MGPYFNLIERVIEHMEAHLSEPMRVEAIAGAHHLSEYFFARLFRIIVGQSPGQYLQGRRLSVALQRLRDTNDSILSIALDSGFTYPEVFSRAFKRQFGVSPTVYRKERPIVAPVEKAQVIPRALVNHQGSLTVAPLFIDREPIWVEGVTVTADVTAQDFAHKLKLAAEAFMDAAATCGNLSRGELCSLVKCKGDGGQQYDVYYGLKVADVSAPPQFQRRLIPGGNYAVLEYTGKMEDVREIFTDDLFRWILLKDVRLCCDEFSMMAIYDRHYLESNRLNIYLPLLTQ